MHIVLGKLMYFSFDTFCGWVQIGFPFPFFEALEACLCCRENY